MKKLISFFVIIAFVTACGGTQKEESVDVSQMTESELKDHAKKIHYEVITLDTHDDINTSNFTEETNYTQRLSTQVNLPKMEEGGLDVAWFVVYTGQGELTEEGFANAYENADDKEVFLSDLSQYVYSEINKDIVKSSLEKTLVPASKKNNASAKKTTEVIVTEVKEENE